jgi:hypothetical protein
VGLFVFVCVFGGALIGLFLRNKLPEHHLSTETKDIVMVAIALVGTMSALVLGLLIASAKSTYDTRRNQLLQVSADIILLDSALAHYGPETQDARALLRQDVARALEQFWPANGSGPVATERKHPRLRVYLVRFNDSRRRTTRNARRRIMPKR